jgi:peptide-methionine (S)-S-oxide reductase
MLTEIATLGAGCFWCVEAVFSSLPGVATVQVGYSNGFTENPTYEQVCSGDTGYAEVAQIQYNPSLISFDQILEHFFATHDPTTLNKQGADHGTQYRSGIFYHNENQKKIALEAIESLNMKKVFKNPIVTEVSKLEKFHIAEDYHQDYYKNNKSAPYCMFVIKPKLDKLEK